MTAHSYVALNYATELHEWAGGKHDNDVRVVQLPYSQVSHYYNKPSRVDTSYTTAVHIAKVLCTIHSPQL